MSEMFPFSGLIEGLIEWGVSVISESNTVLGQSGEGTEEWATVPDEVHRGVLFIRLYHAPDGFFRQPSIDDHDI